ncbi:MAG: hypothetical protein GTO45_21595 [Candidatus Aminicenantes bacterium]|nr:hypothetical protein [Candidatus Aminicenantes bacterium]NIM81350.1 hypothetical protein [Candidatus Aminicenantes bacterium]NIN20761.1 hypothetical protein [Candidatus Aminicenantes bacterium]NIN44539.1 hypothetical protein [Candidatus Aminicenantes bacterium]NIN87359.1 hypothetical protein [Candidatus Aminicenantes bacterium]
MKCFRVFGVIVMIFVLGTNLMLGAGRYVVKVRMNDGKVLKGELLAVLDRNLVLFDRTGDKELRVSIDRVTQISIVRKPRMEKVTLNGMGIGIITVIAASSSNRDTHYDYPQFSILVFGTLGGLLGGLSALIPRPKKKYSIQGMSAAEVQQFLVFLRRFTQKEDVYNGLMGRFRLSWRPFFHPSSPVKIKGKCQVAADSSPLDPQAFNYEFHMHSPSYAVPNRIVRVRLDYVLRHWLSFGFEFVTLGERNVRARPDLELIQDQQSYISYLSFTGTYKVSAVLLGVNLGESGAWGGPAGARYEVGIGLASSSMALGSHYRGTLSLGDRHSFQWLSPAFQLGVAWEFSPRALLSTGIYASYLYIPAFFPGLQASGNLDFIHDTEGRWSDPPAFKRDAVLNIPKSRIDLGGFSLGVFIRIR